MNIVLLGWGSLTWNSGGVSLADGWLTGGPPLPLEFSRVSRDGRLTLVIDEGNGREVPTRYASSTLRDVDSAFAELQHREGTVPACIGCWQAPGAQQAARPMQAQQEIRARIQAWAFSMGADAVLWTALGPNFETKTGLPYSHPAALQYLDHLQGDTRRRALEYIDRAPPEVTTPFRQYLTESGFQLQGHP